MRRRSRRWLGAVALLAAAAVGAILANFALLDAAAGDEPVGKLSPLMVLTGGSGETGTGTGPSSPTVTETIPTESVEPPSETGNTFPDDDRTDDSRPGEDDRDGDRGEDDRDD